MHAAVLGPTFYTALAVSVLFLHALFILWVVFGALLTRSRPVLRWLHIASLVWGSRVDGEGWSALFIEDEACYTLQKAQIYRLIKIADIKGLFVSLDIYSIKRHVYA